MEHLATAIVLSAALLASGVLRSLFKLSAPRQRERPKPLRAVTRSKPRLVTRAKPAPTVRASKTLASPKSPSDSPYRSDPPDQTAVGRSQLHQLAHRLSRLESALDVGGVAISVSNSPARAGETRGQIVEQSRRGLDTDEIACNTGLSRSEVELMLKMHAMKP